MFVQTCSLSNRQVSLRWSTKHGFLILTQISKGKIRNHSSASSPGSESDLSNLKTYVKLPLGGEMRSWQIHAYGGIDDLQLSKLRVPPIKSPSDVLVKVQASSVNPIDLAMIKGYGAESLNVLRGLCDLKTEGPFELPLPKQFPPFVGKKPPLIEFPLTLGRDFSGTITDMGHSAKGKHGLRIGDEVYGVLGVQRQGSHADYVVAPVDTIRRKPRNLSFVEAASIPYVGLTSWSAIKVTGAFSSLTQKKFLVLGGSGGVGTFAVQYLKAHSANVVTVCSTDAEALMKSLGCDFVIDYKLPGYATFVKQYSPYDCILDLTGPTSSDRSMEFTKYLKPTGQFITLSPPFLSNMDKFGFFGGTIKNLGDLLSSNIKTWNNCGAVTKWAFFLPNGCPLDIFADLVESQKIQPVIHETFRFDEIPRAFRKLEEGHIRGKVVINMQ